LLEHISQTQEAAWHNRSHREETLCTALAALHLYRRDRDYLVQDDAVVIVDEATGRLAQGRRWSRGLHQLIELKEGCKATEEQVTAAQITYQRFFARYLRLGGMSGTLCEARSELATVYGLDVVRVALRRLDRRVLLPTRLVRDHTAQWREVAVLARQISGSGRPVLIGTDSVADSDELSSELTRIGLAHQVLNARHDAQEAQIVAAAGKPGRITVATNMAGRGTDIALGTGVAERGGLHVICCQHNASRRIDRQLIGRCARQGDPGSAQTLICVSKPLMTRVFPQWLLLRVGAGLSGPRWLVALLVRLPQWQEERRQRVQRRLLQQQDARTERELFVGVRGD
jgi:preprotein translocase subunit SecA